MSFHRARLKPTINVYIRQGKISLTKSTKFLGIIIDNKLKLTEHITYVNNKISKFQVYCLKQKNILIKTIILFICLSISDICIEIWGNASNIHLDPIIKLQKR